MIKFHYHTSRPRGVNKQGRSCHIYSDEGLGELMDWGEAHGFTRAWLQLSRQLPHFDAWGSMLKECRQRPAVDGGEGVTNEEIVKDMRAWRAKHIAGVR